MLFNFALFPLGETIIDRLEPDGKHSSLCWYNLTDGWYWIEADTAQLFRYTPEWMALWSAQDPCPVHWPYVDYQVVRLWEDLLEILPKVMEPLRPRWPNDSPPRSPGMSGWRISRAGHS